MHPSKIAQEHPERVAFVFAESGESRTFGELERRSNAVAHLFRQLGLQPGDVIAVFLENHPRLFDIVWGAQRSGLYYVLLPSKLTADEAEYIIRDSDARMLITSTTIGDAPNGLASRLNDLHLFAVGGARSGYEDLDKVTDGLPTTPIADERAGQDMLYSSGTTGRPKGVRRDLPDPDLLVPDSLMNMAVSEFGMSEKTVYLSPAPLYHAAPLRWAMVVQRLGGTVVVMSRFDAERALALIETCKVTHSQWVPTHFVRMLRLPEATRDKYDLSSHQVAIHAAAPCPVPVKAQMIDWWGRIIFEYYGGTEGAGFCLIGPQEWLDHKGSVGRSMRGTLRICDEKGDEVPIRQIGDVYFDGGPDFSYHKDPDKTAASRNKHGWRTLGDVGYQDEEGYLYLTDRKKFMIISGGVNIYPQEIENAFLGHAAVQDVAVFGLPDEEFGEKVVAVIEPREWSGDGEALKQSLNSYIREKVSRVKAPKEIYFEPVLPREPTGKLMKRQLKDAYLTKLGQPV